MLKAYSFGLFTAAIGLLVAAMLWFGVQPTEERGLLWGDKIYDTREEFNGYLKSKGLSYETWLARNPGIAPWEEESFTLGAITVKESPKKVQLLLAVVAWMLATSGALLLLRDLASSARLATGSVALFSTVLAVVLVVAFWHGTKPDDERGLLWGGVVYTSKEQFNVYLKSRGLSYKTWLARNPGAAPWEPEPAAASARKSTKPRLPASAAAADRRDGWGVPSLLLPALGFAFAAGLAVLLIRGRGAVTATLAGPFGPVHLPRGRRGGFGSTLSATAATSGRRLGGAALRAAGSVRASAPVYGSRVGRASRHAGRLLLELAREHEISGRDVAIALLLLVGAVVWGAIVVFALSAL